MDRSILLWRTTGDCANHGILTGHQSAVLDLHWSRDSQVVYSASADQHIASFNVETGERIRRHVGHDGVVNCLDVSKRGEEVVVSGGDDGSIGVWDPRQKRALDYIETAYPVTAVCLAEAGNELFSGSIDNQIRVWDLRMKKVAYTLTGHTDTVTSLAISPDAQTLLSYSHDSTARTWDIRPFAPTDRAVKTLDGAPAGLEKNLIRASWDSEGRRMAAGGGDGTVTVWNNLDGKILHKLPGHKGAVNDVRISPDGSMGESDIAGVEMLLPTDQHLVLSASTDRTMLLGELPR
jgi:Prp8 binding protein